VLLQELWFLLISTAWPEEAHICCQSAHNLSAHVSFASSALATPDVPMHVTNTTPAEPCTGLIAVAYSCCCTTTATAAAAVVL
jgi:hypothetical protein